MTTQAHIQKLTYQVECAECLKTYEGTLEGDVLNMGNPRLHQLVDEDMSLFGWKIHIDPNGATLFDAAFCSDSCYNRYMDEEENEKAKR